MREKTSQFHCQSNVDVYRYNSQFDTTVVRRTRCRVVVVGPVVLVALQFSLSSCTARGMFVFVVRMGTISLLQLRIGLLDWGQTKELCRLDREKVAGLILAVSNRHSRDIVTR